MAPAVSHTHYGVLASSLAYTALCCWVGLYHFDWIPSTFREGGGLTPFKIASEYLIIGLLAVAAGFFHARRTSIDFDATSLLVAVALTVLSELCFTLYANVTDTFNLMGHLYKVLAHGMLYQLVFVRSVQEPYVKLERQERQLRTAQAMAHLGSAEWHIPNDRQIWSDELYRILGYAPATAVPSRASLAAVFHPDDRERCLLEAQSALNAQGPCHAEYRIVRPDGEMRHIEVVGEVERDGEGRPWRMVGAVLDVTEQKTAQAAIRRLNQIYSALSETNQTIVRCDDEAELIRRICRIAVEFGGMKMAWFGRVDETSQRVLPVQSYGEGAAHLDGVEISLRGEHAAGLDPVGKAVREGKPQVVNDFAQAAAVAPWRERIHQHGWKSAAAFPVPRGGNPHAVLIVYGHDRGAFDEKTCALLAEMAGDISYALDAIDQRAAHAEAVEKMQLAARVFATTDQGIVITDAAKAIVSVNQAFTDVTAYVSDEVRHWKFDRLQFRPEEGVPDAALWQEVLEHGRWRGKVCGQRKDGSTYPAWLSVTTFKDAAGKVLNYIAVFADISDILAARRQIEYLAHFDPLTNLPNRALLQDRAGTMLASAQRDHKPAAVLFLDLDRFKTVNDTLGHHLGDRLLQQVARRIESTLGHGDTLSRLGETSSSSSCPTGSAMAPPTWPKKSWPLFPNLMTWTADG